MPPLLRLTHAILGCPTMRLRSGAVFAPYDLKRSFRLRIPLYNPISTLVSVEPLIQGAVEREDLRFEQGWDDSEGLGVTSRPPTPLVTEIESEDSDEAESIHPNCSTPQAHDSESKHSFRLRIPPYNPISRLVSVEPLIQGAVETLERELTENESEDEAESLHPTTSDTQSNAKKRRNAGAKKRRAKKRARFASSGHQPHAYAAKPSTVSHHAEEMKPLRVSSDAKDFPASGTGSWVGQRRNDAAKKEPWTVAELVKNNFTFVEWDGQ